MCRLRYCEPAVTWQTQLQHKSATVDPEEQGVRWNTAKRLWLRSLQLNNSLSFITEESTDIKSRIKSTLSLKPLTYTTMERPFFLKAKRKTFTTAWKHKRARLEGKVCTKEINPTTIYWINLTSSKLLSGCHRWHRPPPHKLDKWKVIRQQILNWTCNEQWLTGNTHGAVFLFLNWIDLTAQSQTAQSPRWHPQPHDCDDTGSRKRSWHQSERETKGTNFHIWMQSTATVGVLLQTCDHMSTAGWKQLFQSVLFIHTL